jgi:secondary thiamine-phosphate synthase enzyme
MKQLSLKTDTQTSFVNITNEVQRAVSEQGVESGVITVFVPHTTAGITINECADPDVVTDMKQVLDKLVPWNDGYRHLEGNTAAHVKASMMGSSIQVIVEGGRLQLGTWQGIYFCEFDGPRSRTCWVK